MGVTAWPPAADLPWIQYVPEVTTSSDPQPSGWSRAGFYRQNGSLVIVRFIISAPAANFGNGQYSVSLPVKVSPTYPSYTPVGNAFALDASPSATYTAVIRVAGGATTCQVAYFASSPTYGIQGGYYGSNAGPFTFAQNDYVSGQLIYEAAA